MFPATLNTEKKTKVLRPINNLHILPVGDLILQPSGDSLFDMGGEGDAGENNKAFGWLEDKSRNFGGKLRNRLLNSEVLKGSYTGSNIIRTNVRS